MSRRQKIAAWLVIGVVFCMAMLTRSRYVDGLPWRKQVVWYGFWFGILFGLVVLARFVAPPLRLPETPFTVQSEAPEHVISVDGG